MLHLSAVLPGLAFAAAGHYHQLTDDIDDIIESGLMKYENGAIRVPRKPGLGVKLDREKDWINMPNPLDISNRVAVVIGGSSGIGRALAVGLAAQGATVIPTARREDLLWDVCRAIEESGQQTLCRTADVHRRSSIDELRDTVLARFGRVDILVNAAGYTMTRLAARIGEEEWRELMDTNLTGVLRTCRSFYEPLKANGRGRVINIASLGAFLSFHEVAAYCASKAAVLALTKNLACEWAKDGICVNAIAPGIFPTELNSKLILDTPRGRELLMRTPMARFGKPEELVGVAVLLSSDAASFLTGQCIVV